MRFACFLPEKPAFRRAGFAFLLDSAHMLQGIERAGKRYPVCIEPMSRFVVELEGDDSLHPELASLARPIAERELRGRKGVYNGQAFTLIGRSGNRLRLGVRYFFDHYGVCRVLERNDPDAMAVLEPLIGDDPLQGGAGWRPACGVHGLLIAELDGASHLLMGIRSTQVALAGGQQCAAPAGMLAPLPNHSADTILEANLRHELEEEVRMPLTVIDCKPLGLVWATRLLMPNFVYLLTCRVHDPTPQLARDEYSHAYWLDLTPPSLARFWQTRTPQDLIPATAGALVLLEQYLTDQTQSFVAEP